MLFDTREAIEYKKAWEWYNNIVRKSFTLSGKSGIIEKDNSEQPRDPNTGQWVSVDGVGSGSSNSESSETGASTGEKYAKERVTAYIENPKTLGDTTHKEKYDDFKAHGIDVQPLNKGNHEGKPYEDGGGFKITLDEDGKNFISPGRKKPSWGRIL